MNRDLTEKELSSEVRHFFDAFLITTKQMIDDGILKGCSLGCPAIDDERMLPMANKMCGVQADFIYFYTVIGNPDNFFADRENLKELTNDCLPFLKGRCFDDAEVLESNVISSQKKTGINNCVHFVCFLMKKRPVKCDA